MDTAWADGDEPEHGTEEDGGKGSGLRRQTDKTENKTGWEILSRDGFCPQNPGLDFFSAPKLVDFSCLPTPK
jgi:hypothetical protein